MKSNRASSLVKSADRSLSRREFLGEARKFAALAGFAYLGLGQDRALADERAATGPATRGSGGQSFEEIRRRFLLPRDMAYMNCGTLGPAPACVIDQSYQAWRKMEENPADEGFGSFLGQAEQVRAKAAALLACDKDEIVITRNTTEGMNTVAQGMDWQRGDRILTTDQEHEGGSVCWRYFAKRCGLEIDQVRLPLSPRSADEVLKLFEAKLTKRTRVVSVSHVTFTTGLRLPVREIAALAHASGALTVVDGAQSAGALNVDVRAIGCDAYAASGHKWLLGPKGTGILYIRKEAADKIHPLLLDQGRSVYTTATGTRNIIGIIGLGMAIDFLGDIGKDRAQKRAMALAAGLYDKLKNVPEATLVSPPPGELSSPLVSLRLPDKVDNADLAARLRRKHSIIVKVLPKTAFNGIRMSSHVFNNDEDYQRLAAALKKEMA